MNLRIAAIALLPVPLSAALAPDSIQDKVFHEYRFTGPSLDKRIIDFLPTGRYIYLYHASGNPVTMRAPPSDGSYSYLRTSDGTGRISLRADDGTAEEIGLTFSGSSDGSVQVPAGPSRDARFMLRDGPIARMPSAYNMSIRGRVAPNQPMIVGLAVPGGLFATALVRVVGPSLASFGISGFWRDPDFTIVAKESSFPIEEAHHDDWNTPLSQNDPGSDAGASLNKIFAYVGAFPLVPRSKDSVDVINLRRSNYTIVCAPKAGDEGGEVLVEVYFLP